MQHEKKPSGHRRRLRTPEVSIRVNVRPLRSNWKPVKRVEFDGQQQSTETPSPAQDQLDSNVWKTKNVRTEFVPDNKKITEKSTKSTDPTTEDSTGEEPSSDVSEECEKSKGPPGLVAFCECAACRRANETPTVAELTPEVAIKPVEKPTKSRREVKHRHKSRKTIKVSAKKSHKSRSENRQLPQPPPVPPNSVASRDSQRKWSKLYDEVCRPDTKPIDFKKISASGQIGMSELEPEDSEKPPPKRSPTFEPQKKFYDGHPSPKILKRPVVSPSSIASFDHHNNNQPPLLPQNTVHSDPPDVQPPPVEAKPGIVTTMVNKVMGTPSSTNTAASEHHDTPPPPKKLSKSASWSQQCTLSSLTSKKSVELIKNHSKTAISTISVKSVSIFRRMEQVFYGSETNWWIFVAFVLLTMIAYRSSIEQHTCYYD